MSTLYVNTIKPQSGSVVAVSGTLDVSGTIKSYALETITMSETTYQGSNKFGNDSTDTHQFTGSMLVTGSGITLIANQAAGSTLTLKADCGDDAVDTATLSVADGGAVTLSGSTSITLDADGGSVLMKDKGTTLFTFAANEIDVASGNLTFDVAGDIVLDADGADISLKDGGTEYVAFNSTTGISGSKALHVVGSASFGSTLTTTGSIGIGTTSPSSQLEIEGSSGDLIFEIDNNASNSANFQIQNGAGNARVDLVMNDGSTNTTLTMKNQRLGIGTTSPTTTLAAPF